MGQIMDDKARELTAPYRANPYRIGYFSDNEVGWWDGALFIFYSPQAREQFHQAALGRRCCAEYYHDDWRRFAARFRAAGRGSFLERRCWRAR